ncbi:MAG: choice-of-anchor D domain-containing protein [Candidatus Eisenbacteria sp.]|nr:choice-of-anchor D domain-containing protein [Candidatus Eisenbacteria bacterium]
MNPTVLISIIGGRMASRVTLCGISLLLVTALVVATSPVIATSAGFVENRGQVSNLVGYYASVPGAFVYFTSEAVVVDLRQARARGGPDPAHEETFPGPHESKDAINRGESRSAPSSGCAVWMRFEGAEPSPTIEARGLLPTRSNYFLGNDREQWLTDVPTYAEVVYRDLWPGIDLTYRLTGGTIVYEIAAGSEADLDQVQFRYEGAAHVEIGEDGSHLVETMMASFTDERPHEGDRGGRLVFGPGGVSRSDPVVRAEAGRDDPSLLAWSTFLGGDSDEIAYDVILDGAACPIVTGFTFSPSFPTTPGAYDRSHGGFGVRDVFVAKLDAAGSGLLWSTFLGGSGWELGYGLALDDSENVVVTGYTDSSDFPVTSGAYDETFNGYYDAFVAKLSASGSSLLWCTFLGGSSWDQADAVVVCDDNDVVLTGDTDSDGFPTTPGAYGTSHNGGFDAFVAKLDASGSSLVWSTFLGGSGGEGSNDVDLDDAANPVVTGGTSSPEFPTTPGAYDESHNGSTDAFVTKLDVSGSTVLWSTFLGGSNWESGSAVHLDPEGRPIIAGATCSPGFPTTPGAHDESLGGTRDAFAVKLDATGSDLLSSTFLGGSDLDYAYGLALDPAGNPVVTGTTTSQDFPTTVGAYDQALGHPGFCDAFIAQLETFAWTLMSSTYLGGADSDYGYAVAVDPADVPIVTGLTFADDFPTTPGAYDESFNGGSYDVILTKVELPPAPPPACEVSPTYLDFGPVPWGEYRDSTVTIANVGESILHGDVSASCDHYSLVSGEGPYSLEPDEWLEVTIRFEPTDPGTHDCTVATGSEFCSDVYCTGQLEGELSCDVSPDNLDFGAVTLGDYRDESFTITNTGVGVLEGSVSESCSYYSLVFGAGPYALEPDEWLEVTVRFAPTAPGTHECTIETGSEFCSDVHCTGELGGELVCNVYPDSLAFGELGMGEYRDQHFTIKNAGEGVLEGSVAEWCDHYSIESGGGDYVLYPEDSLRVTVRFAPTSLGIHDCEVATGSVACSDVPCTGIGGPENSTVEWCRFPPGECGEVLVCPAGDGDDWLLVTIRDEFGDPVEGAIAWYAIETSCGYCICEPIGAGTNGSGEAVIYPHVGLDCSTDTSCCEVTTRVVCMGETIPWTGSGGALANTRSWRSFDLNGDCVVNVGDLAIFQQDYASGNACRSNYSCDGDVDLADYVIFMAHFNDEHQCEPFSSVDETELNSADLLALGQNRPNPLRAGTCIRFTMTSPGRVRLCIYDIGGRRVRLLIDGFAHAGDQEIRWDGKDDGGEQVAAGVYFYRLAAPGYSGVKKMTVLE